MALITRLTRLFQADMHAVLDKIEEPALLLKQCIRDMEESIATDERQIRCWEYEQQQLAGKHDQLTEILTGLEDKVALCFKSQKDGLARSLIKRKLETQLSLQRLSEKITALKEKTARLTSQLAEHQAQLTAMKQKAEVLLDDNRVNSCNWENPAVTVREEDVEVAFLYEQQKWSES